MLDASPSCETEIFLVSSPGFGVLDSVCGKTIIGEQTYEEFCRLLKKDGVVVPPLEAEVNRFRFGNGQSELSTRLAKLHAFIAGRPGFLKAALVKGRAPLLVSRSALQSLRASINFGDNSMTIFDDQVRVPLQVNAAGQYVLHLLKSDSSPEVTVQGTGTTLSSHATHSSSSSPSSLSLEQNQDGNVDPDDNNSSDVVEPTPSSED